MHAVQGGPERGLALVKPGGGHCILGVAVQGGPDRGLALLKPKGGHDIPKSSLEVLLVQVLLSLSLKGRVSDMGCHEASGYGKPHDCRSEAKITRKD